MSELIIKVSPVSLTKIIYSKNGKQIAYDESSSKGFEIFTYIQELQNKKIIGKIDKISLFGNTAYIKGLLHKFNKYSTNPFANIPTFIEGQQYIEEKGD